MKWLLVSTLFLAMATASSAAEPLTQPKSIRVSLLGSIAVVTHRDGHSDTVPCGDLNVGREAYFASVLVLARQALNHIEDRALVQEFQAARPRIAAYNRVALLCERAGELAPDPKTDHLARRLDRAFRKLDEMTTGDST